MRGGAGLGWLGRPPPRSTRRTRAGSSTATSSPRTSCSTRDGDVRVADFGIASAAGLASFTKTGDGPRHRRLPVARAGQRRARHTGQRPLRPRRRRVRAARRPPAVRRGEPDRRGGGAHACADPVRPRDEPALPPKLDAVFSRALAKDPEARYRTAAEFVADLRDALDRPADATARITPPVPATAPTRRATSTAVTRRGGGGASRWWIPALAAALALAGALVAYAATRDDGEPQAAPTSVTKRAATTRAAPGTTTFVRTVTAPGTTVERTVTAAPPPPATTQREPTTTAAPTTTRRPSARPPPARRSTTRVSAGCRRATTPARSRCSSRPCRSSAGPADRRGVRHYNLAYTRFALGNCDGVKEMLDNSQGIQGKRTEIDDLRKEAKAVSSLSAESLGVLPLVVRAVVAGLDRLPPVAVRAVPLDRLGEARAVERVPRHPAERAQLRRVDRVAAVVAGAVGDVADEVGRRAGQVEDPPHDVHVLALLPADVVDLAGRALAQHELDRSAVVVDVQPLAASGGRRRRPEAASPSSAFVTKSGRNFSGYCRGPYVFAPRVIERVDAVRADVREHLHVAAGLRRRVRARGPQRRVLGRRGRAGLDVAVDLVGRDLDVADPVVRARGRAAPASRGRR